VVYNKTSYQTGLTDTPREMDQMNRTCNRCISRCRPIYPRINANVTEIDFLPDIRDLD
jgi:hypothetical protein